MTGTKEQMQENPNVSRISSWSDPILIIRLKLKIVWLTRSLIREEGSWTFFQNAGKNEKFKSYSRHCIHDTLN